MANQANKGGGFFTFLVGIAAGAAAGYYLSTEEGRRMRERLGDKSRTLSNDAATFAKDTSAKVNDNLQTALEQSRTAVNDLTATVKTRIDDYSTNVRQQVDKTSTSFQEGIERGRAKLEKQKAEIETLVKGENNDN